MKYSRYNPAQIEQIRQLFTEAFSASDGAEEGATVGTLAYSLITQTHDRDLLAFVVTQEQQLIGSVIFSRLLLECHTNAFLLSPLAVHPDYQGKGVGQNLTTFALNALKEQGVEAVFTYGDPDFYSRVGFKQLSEKQIKAPHTLTQPHGWQGQSLTDSPLTLTARHSFCVEALNRPEYW